MPHWVPSWQLAAVLAGCLIAVGWGVLARRPHSPRLALVAAFTREVGVVLGLFALWQFAGSLALRGSTAGLERGEQLWHVERVLHLPSEASLQRLFLPHPLVVEFFNGYYVYAHYNALLLTLAWLFLRHRDVYWQARSVIVLTTFACLAIQLVPVAPPRLLASHGLVDTATAYGQSVYGPVGTGLSDQYSAMPSVHVAWAAAVAVFAWRATRSRWRWLAVAHAVLTLVVVVATANHFWLDGIVAAGLLTLACLLVWRLAARSSRPLAVAEPPGRLPDPVPVASGAADSGP